MRLPRQPLFLARAVYRRRRLRDGARMLPIFGFVLLQLPLLWPQGIADQFMAKWVYLFAVWIGLIVLAALLAPRLGADPGSEEDLARPGPKDNATAVGGQDAL